MIQTVIDAAIRYVIARELSKRGLDPSRAGAVLEKGRKLIDRAVDLAEEFERKGERPEQAKQKAQDAIFPDKHIIDMKTPPLNA